MKKWIVSFVCLLAIMATSAIADDPIYEEIDLRHNLGQQFYLSSETDGTYNYTLISNGFSLILQNPVGMTSPTISSSTSNGLLHLNVEYAPNSGGGCAITLVKYLDFDFLDCSAECSGANCGCAICVGYSTFSASGVIELGP
jgi:hypothetical protein